MPIVRKLAYVSDLHNDWIPLLVENTYSQRQTNENPTKEISSAKIKVKFETLHIQTKPNSLRFS
jgi:hypothetical protein